MSWQPKWHEMEIVGRARSVSAAMDRFYKPDRLNRDPGTRERLIADREQCIAEDGFDVLASHHDSVTGRGVWIRPRADNKGFEILSPKRQ